MATDVIGIWMDETSEEEPHWIVSRDRWSPDDGSEMTDTVKAFQSDDYDSAREFAIALGKKEGKSVVRTDVAGPWYLVV